MAVVLPLGLNKAEHDVARLDLGLRLGRDLAVAAWVVDRLDGLQRDRVVRSDQGRNSVAGGRVPYRSALLEGIVNHSVAHVSQPA